MHKIIKKILYFFSICLIYIILSFLVPKNSSAKTTLDEATLDIFAENNIMFYDPTENTDCFPNSSASLTAGSTYEERIWNYFVESKIPGVWNNPAVIAGIMGNFYTESGYDPFAVNEIGMTGIFQGCTATDDCHEFLPIKEKVEQAVGDYWFVGVGEVDSHPPEPTSTAIRIELDALTQNEPKTDYGKNFLNIFIKNLDKVSYTSGVEGAASYAELFQVVIERGVQKNGEKLKDQKVQKFVDEHIYGPKNEYYHTGYQTMTERRQNAQDIYNRYASSTPSSTSSSVASSTSTDDCFHSASEPFVRYDQTDEKYKNVTYGKGENASSAAESGCGPFSFAMLATALGVQNIDPAEVTKVAGDLGMHVSGGSDHDITEELANHYNMTYQKIDTGVTGTYGNTLSEDNINKVIEAINSKLKEGWMIHTSGIAPIDQESTWGNPFTPGGHYIGIRGLTSDGKWLLADSNGPNGPNKIKEGTIGDVNYKYTRKGDQNSTKEWDPKDVVAAGLNITNLRAIRASNATPCGNYTTGGPCGGSVSGGLSDSDAQKLVDHYLAMDPTGYYMPDVHVKGNKEDDKWNCVGLSIYFFQKITTYGKITANQLFDNKTGNGWRVATQLNKSFGLPLGTTAKPYAIFSTALPGSGPCPDSYGHDGELCGHTGLIVSVNGEDITYIEASYNKSGYAGVGHAKLSDFKNDYAPNGLFVYLDDVLDRSAIQSLLNGEN